MTTIAELQESLNGVAQRLTDTAVKDSEERAALVQGVQNIRVKINAAFDDVVSLIERGAAARNSEIDAAFGGAVVTSPKLVSSNAAE